jgi:hypothetical protein
MKNQIEMDILKSHIKEECGPCHIKEKIETNTQCENCNFALGRDGAYLKENKLKLKITKSHLFYFLIYPELNFKFPPLPIEDFFGNKRKGKMWRWELHHEDGNHWNDVSWNMILVLKSEHMFLHGGVRITEKTKAQLRTGASGTKERIKKQLITRRKNKTLYVGCIKPKLTKEQVIEIRKRLLKGETSTSLSKNLKIPLSTIDNIKHYNCWKDVKVEEV